MGGSGAQPHVRRARCILSKRKPKKTSKRVVVVDLDATKPRKKSKPRPTAYSKEHPSPFAFKPGQSGSPGGKPKSGEKRLLSKAIRTFLSDMAPDELAKGLGLPANSHDGKRYQYSMAQCLGRNLIVRSLRGESWAASLVVQLVEPQNSRLTIGGFDGEDGEECGKILELVMVSSDGNGNISKESLQQFPELSAKTIEGQRPNLPAPED